MWWVNPKAKEEGKEEGRFMGVVWVLVCVCCGLWYVKWGPLQQLDGVHMSVDRVFVKFIPPEALLLLLTISMVSESLHPSILLFLLFLPYV